MAVDLTIPINIWKSKGDHFPLTRRQVLHMSKGDHFPILGRQEEKLLRKEEG